MSLSFLIYLLYGMEQRKGTFTKTNKSSKAEDGIAESQEDSGVDLGRVEALDLLPYLNHLDI